jgi:hypothetical protein
VTTTTKQQAFTVFWENYNPPSAVVIAADFSDCMRIASTYGVVRSITTESTNVIIAPKPVEEPSHA